MRITKITILVMRITKIAMTGEAACDLRGHLESARIVRWPIADIFLSPFELAIGAYGTSETILVKSSSVQAQTVWLRTKPRLRWRARIWQCCRRSQSR